MTICSTGTTALLPAIKTRENRHSFKSNAPEKTTCFQNANGTFMVPVTGLEPVHCCQRGILSPLRLPIPPHRHFRKCIIKEKAVFVNTGCKESRLYMPGPPDRRRKKGKKYDCVI